MILSQFQSGVLPIIQQKKKKNTTLKMPFLHKTDLKGDLPKNYSIKVWLTYALWIKTQSYGKEQIFQEQ